MLSRCNHTSSIGASARWIRSIALASGVAGVALLSGCDRAAMTSDGVIETDVATALPRINSTDQDRNKAESSLRHAIKETAASPVQQIYAKELLAQVELRSAEALQPQIDANQSALLARSWEIGQLAIAMGASAEQSLAMQKLDPAPALAAVKKNTTDAQGSADAPDWIKTDSGSIASLASVTADIAKLKGQISDLQTKLQQANDQHTQLQAQADQLDQQSQQARGDAAVAQFTRASNLRKQADDLNVQIDGSKVALGRAQADLSVRTGQQESLNGAIHDFGEASSQIDQNWQLVQKQSQASNAQAKAILGDAAAATDGDSTGGVTISSKAARLQQLADTDGKLRGQAEAHVNSAVDFLNQAITQAEQLERVLKSRISAPETSDKSEVAAWNGTVAAIDPAQLRLQLASAQLRLGNLVAGEATELAARAQSVDAVKAVADAATLTLPDTLTPDPKLASDLTSARQSATTSYKDATETLSKISEGSAPDADKDAAHQSAMYAYYQWSLLDSSANDTQNAKEHYKTAQTERDAMTTPPSGLPPALAIVPVKPATPPGTMMPGASMAPPTAPPPQ